MNMRRGFVAFIFTAALLPLAALAAGTDLPAGFAPNSIWVSRTQITAGDTVNIFTVVYNSSDVPLAGDVGFTVDGKPVGIRNFSIKAGETRIESVPWTALAGNHSIFARIEKISDSNTNESASVLNQTTDTVTISVAEPPPPSPTAQAISSVASAVQTGVASSLPIITNVTQGIYSATEGARNAAIDVLEKQVAKNAPANANAKKETPAATAGKVVNSPSSSAYSPSSMTASVSSFISSSWQNILKGLLFISKTKMLFYFLLAFVIFILFQLLRTWMRECRT